MLSVSHVLEEGWKGHLRICSMIMENGGDVNVTDGEHHSPVHVAAHMGHTAILSFLTQVHMI